MPVWRDPERGQYGYADHTFRHPHFQVEAVQVNDRVDLLAESTVLPFLEALLQPANSPWLKPFRGGDGGRRS